MHTPPETKAYEEEIALRCRQAMTARAAFTGPVSVSIFVVMRPPASWAKKRQQDAMAGLNVPTSRPDLDNVLKAILDGMNGIAYGDDAQVVSLSASKRYGPDEGVDVRVARFEYEFPRS